YYLPKINRTDPQSLIRILPKSFLNSDVNAIKMPIRVLNVLGANGIKKISDLSDISTDEMLKWPNFGKKSMGDLSSGLINAVEYLSSSINYSKSDSSCLVTIKSDLPEKKH